MGSARRVDRDGRSPSRSHAKNPTMMTCEIPEHGREPCSDRLDGVVPKHEVAGERDAREGRHDNRASRQRAVALPLPERHEHEQRQPEDRSIERAGRRRDGGVQIEDARERDARRAEQCGQAWPLREPVERPEILRTRVAQVLPCFTPTKRRPSSSYCPGSGIDGASSIGSVPDWVFGKAITSRMFV